MDDAGQRLDKYLIKYFDKANISFVYKNLRKGNIKLNLKKVTGDRRISPGDELELFFSLDTLSSLSSYTKNHNAQAALRSDKDDALGTSLVSGKCDLVSYGSIVFENDHIIIFNKKAGILSQKSRSTDISLNEALFNYVRSKKDKARLNEDGDIFTPSICNRLDRNTAGLIIFTKTYAANVLVNTLLKEHRLKKYYLALVKGKINAPANLRGWLKKDWRKNIVTVTKNKLLGSFYIEMSYEPIMMLKRDTILKIDLMTGKSHQIRAQLAAVGHPVLGDRKYGDIGDSSKPKSLLMIDHQPLYAWRLVWPRDLSYPLEDLSGVTMTIETPFDEIIGSDNLLSLS